MIARGNPPKFINSMKEIYPRLIKEFSKDKYDSLVIRKEDDYILENTLRREKVIIPGKTGEVNTI